MDLHKVNQLALIFLDQIFKKIESKKVIIESYWSIDHLCYRTSTQNQYLDLKNKFSEFSELLIESSVNGRLISTFKLSQPIKYKNWSIDLIELPAPKSGKTTIEGFEHIEVVCDVSFEQIKQNNSDCDFDESGLCKKINPELEIKLDELAIKFHHMSLEEVIKLEKDQRS